MKLGGTGTKEGWNGLQEENFRKLIFKLKPSEYHHGDCIGFDAQSHDVVRELLPNCKIIIHPSNLNNKRAFKEGDEIREPKPPLIRNKDIVNESDEIVASPKQNKEMLRSGTWATIRYILKMGKVLHFLER